MNHAMPSGAAAVVPASIEASTNEAYALVTLTLPPYHPGVPLHQHPIHTEGCYVIQGTLAATQDGRTITLMQGDLVVIPSGTTHTYWNPTAAPTTVLVSYHPSNQADTIIALATGIESDLVVYAEC